MQKTVLVASPSRVLVKLLSVILVCCLLFSVLPTAVFAAPALNKDNLADGTYYVDVAFMHVRFGQTDRPIDVSTADKSLMSRSVPLLVEGGKYSVLLELKAISQFGDTSYLSELHYYLGDGNAFTYDTIGDPTGDYQPVPVTQIWRNPNGTVLVDKFNNASTPYPRVLKMPLVYKMGAYSPKPAASKSLYPVLMCIPIMQTPEYPVGIQPALLQIKWETLRAPSSIVVAAPSSFTSTLKTIYVKKGSTITIPMMVNGSTSNPTTLNWTSSKPKVASIAAGKASGQVAATITKVQNLRIKGAAVGTSTITLSHTNGSKRAFKVVVVKKATPLKAVKMQALPKKNTMKAGTSKQLGVKLTPAKATLSGTVVKWTSSNKSVASVDASGKITALKAGKTNITVKVGSKKATVAITVKK